MGARILLSMMIGLPGVVTPCLGQPMHTLIAGWHWSSLRSGADMEHSEEVRVTFGPQQGSGFVVGYTHFPDRSKRVGVRWGAVLSTERSSGSLTLGASAYPYYYHFVGTQQLRLLDLDVPVLASVRVMPWCRINAGAAVDLHLAASSREEGEMTRSGFGIPDTTYAVGPHVGYWKQDLNSVNLFAGGGLTLGPWKRVMLDVRAMYGLTPIEALASGASKPRYPFVLQVALAYDIGELVGRIRQAHRQEG